MGGTPTMAQIDALSRLEKCQDSGNPIAEAILDGAPDTPMPIAKAFGGSEIQVYGQDQFGVNRKEFLFGLLAHDLGKGYDLETNPPTKHEFDANGDITIDLATKKSIIIAHAMKFKRTLNETLNPVDFAYTLKDLANVTRSSTGVLSPCDDQKKYNFIHFMFAERRDSSGGTCLRKPDFLYSKIPIPQNSLEYTANGLIPAQQVVLDDGEENVKVISQVIDVNHPDARQLLDQGGLEMLCELMAPSIAKAVEKMVKRAQDEAVSLTNEQIQQAQQLLKQPYQSEKTIVDMGKNGAGRSV